MSVDSDLLALNDQVKSKSGEKAGDLRQKKRSAQSAIDPTETSRARLAGQEPASLRQAVQERRSLKAIAEAKAAKAIAKATAPVRQGTNRLLQAAWLNIVPSFGWTIIWINIHVFLGTVFGNNFFCKLGAEWIDENIKIAQFEKAKQVGKVAGLVEGMGLAALDLGCLLLIIAVLSLVALIVSVIDNPLKAISSLFGGLWQYLSGQ